VGHSANTDALEERKIPCPCRDSKPGSSSLLSDYYTYYDYPVCVITWMNGSYM